MLEILEILIYTYLFLGIIEKCINLYKLICAKNDNKQTKHKLEE